ncbi:ATP-binding protein [Streptomyces sannanensis]
MTSHQAGLRPPPGTDRYRFELPARPDAVSRARRLTCGRLDSWAVGDETRGTAALVVSELFTNAVMHTASARIVCELRHSDTGIRIAVQDEGFEPGGPKVCETPEDENGRGLLLVAAVSTSWGSQMAAGGAGRVVWAQLPHA